MRKLTSKLALLVLAVALAVVALGTTTFAWFTLGGTAKTDAITVDVTSSTGLEVSYDGITYRNTLSTTDFTAAAAAIKAGVSGTFASNTTNNYGNGGWKMKDVTSPDGKTFYYQHGIKFNYDPDGTAGSGDEVTYDVLTLTNDAAQQYLQFDVWVRKTGSANVGLTATIASDATGTSWAADATVSSSVTGLTGYTGQTITAGTSYVVSAAKAARISVVSHADSDSTIIGETTMGTATGAYYTSAGSDNAGASTTVTGNLALAYDTVKKYTYATKIAGASSADNATDLVLPTSTVKATSEATNEYKIKLYSGADTANSLPAVTATGTSTTRYTVRVWLEGFDADCFNSILNGALSVALKFETVE